MPTIELIPVNKGNPMLINDTTITILGRTPSTGCSDIRISRKHAEIYMKSDGTFWIKPIHHNPIFYKTKSNQIVSLTKDKEYQLCSNDEFGLLPDEYFYRISIKEITQNENEILPTNVSQTNQSVDSSPPLTLTTDTEPNHSNLTSNPSLRKRIHPGDYKPNDDPPTTISSTEQLNVTNDSNLTSSTTVKTRKRERCAYGNSCYRTNPIHRQQASHPGDSDYDDDEEEEEEEEEEQTKPQCPFGHKCYRTNPNHFEKYSHSKKLNNDETDDDTLTTNDESSDQEEKEDDSEWEPEDNSQKSNRNYDDTADESDRELTKREAEEFIQYNSKAKKARFDDD